MTRFRSIGRCYGHALLRCRAAVLPAVVALLLAACAPPNPAESLANARQSFAAGDYRTASIHLQNVLQAEPGNAEARLLVGRIALLTGDFALARGHLEAARAAGVGAAEVGLPLAQAYVGMAEVGRAADLLDSLSDGARSADYWLLRAEVYLLAGMPDDAARSIDAAEAAGGTTARSQLERARVAATRGNIDAALTLADQAIALDPSDAEARSLRGVLRGTAGRLDEAAEDLSAAADLYANGLQAALAAPVLLRLVQIEVARNDIDGAAAAAGRLAELVPNAAFAQYAQGLVAFQRGDYTAAINLLRQAVTQMPGQTQFAVLLGAAHLAAGNFGQAEQQFQSVLAANPSDPAAIRLLAETRIRQQRPRAALDALRLFNAQTDSEDLTLLGLQGLAYLQNGQPELAIPYLEQALDLNPVNPTVALQLAQAYAASGRSEDAGALLRATPGIPADAAYAGNLSVVLGELQSGDEAAARSYVAGLVGDRGDDPGSHMVAAVFHQLVNEIDAVDSELEAALALDPSYVPAQLMRAALLAQDGRTDEAETMLRQVTENDPANLAAWISLARLAIDAGRLEDAEAYLATATQRSDSEVPPIALARLQLARGDFAAAGESVDIAESRAPGDARVALTRGLTALSAGEYATAITALRAAQDGLPELPNVALALAQAQTAGGNRAAAYETLASAVTRMPGVVGLRAALGASALVNDKADETLRIALALQSEFPQQSAGFALEGQLRMTQRDYDAARRLYEQAYDREHSWNMLAGLVTASQLSSSAGGEAALVEEWLTEFPGDTRGRLMLAELDRRRGDLAAAFDQYRAVIATEPDNFVALNDGAWVAHQLGRDEALRYANRAVELAPENGAVVDTLGWILTESGRAQEALPHLLKAAQLSPEVLEIRYHLAVAQSRAGNVEAARDVLESLLSETEPFALRADAAALLESLDP